MGTGNESGGAPLDRAIRHARRRLIPFLVLMYVLAFIDRANVGFGKAVLQADTGIGDAAFAFGAGIFFVGYAICEIPSNLILYRIGARRWMSRIMITWGIVAAAMALTRDAHSFYVLRFLLGVAEAGFFPGIILFLSQWFPASVRARTMGLFYFGLPLALVIGGPLSGLLLDTSAPFGWHSWQMMFVVEGLLASLVGIVAYFFLTDRPAAAHWLADDERAALVEAMDAEDARKAAQGPASVLASLGDRRVLAFTAIYFVIQVSVYGVIFYLPTRIAAPTGGHVGTAVGFLTAIPWLAAMAVTFGVTRLADRTGWRRQLAALMLVVAAGGILGSTLADSTPLAIFAFCFAASGFVAAQPLFWTQPTSYLGGAAAASAIGLINAVGNLGGFVAPNIKNFAEQAAGNTTAGMVVLGLAALLGAAMMCLFGSDEMLRKGMPAQ